MSPDAPFPPARRVAWAVLLILGAFIFAVGSNTYLVREVDAKIILAILTIAVLGGWLAGSIVRPTWRPHTPLTGPVLLAAAAYALSALTSQRPRLSLEPTIGGLAFALAFLLLSRVVADPWFRDRIAAALKVLIGVVVVAYIAQTVSVWVEWWQLIGSMEDPPLRPAWARLHFGSPNTLAAFLATGTPLAVVLVWKQSTGRRWAWVVGAGALVAIVLTGSRASYLGLAASATFAVALIAIESRSRRRSWGLRRLHGLARWIAPAGLLVALLSAIVFPAMLYRFAQGGADVRFDLWASAATIFAEHPISGGGPGTWVQLKIAANPPGAPNLVLSEAHNTYIQAAAELGIVGIATLGILVVAVARRLFQSIRGNDAQRREGIAVSAGLVALSVQCLFASLATMPLMALLVITLVAWVDAGVSNVGVKAAKESKGLDRGAMLSAVGLAAVVIAGLLYVPRTVAELEDVTGNDAAWDQDWHVALEHYEAARRTDPEFTLYSIRVAGALARLGRTAEARALLADAVERDPLPGHLIGLAALDAALGDSATALDRAKQAAGLAGSDVNVALNAGLIAEWAGDLVFAKDQFAVAIAIDPPLAAADLWDDPDRALDKQEIIEAAVRRSDPARTALILAYVGRADDASEVLDKLPPSSVRDVYLAAVHWLDGDTAGAMDRLQRQLEDDPLDWFAAAWLSRIARLSGDQPAAERYARWAFIVQADRAPGVIDEPSAVPAVEDAAIAGLPGAYPSGTYLRETGPYLLMPQLTLVGSR